MYKESRGLHGVCSASVHRYHMYNTHPTHTCTTHTNTHIAQPNNKWTNGCSINLPYPEISIHREDIYALYFPIASVDRENRIFNGICTERKSAKSD